MSLFSWIIFGLFAGWTATLLTKEKENIGIAGYIILGIIGSMIGGFITVALGGTGVSGVNIASMAVAIFGAWVFLSLFHMYRKTTS